MNKRKLKEIINKSKEISAIGDPFDLFVNSLSSKPENYRLRVAWEYYDKPKDYKVGIRLSDDEYARLKRYAEIHNQTMAQILREKVDHIISQDS